MQDFNIEEELKKLPSSPGVYLMHDASEEIIYIGKAISLKNRVRQYFQSSRKRTPKIEQMVSHISYFEYIVTDSELEALILECNLIKEHRPKYNTMLKDDKTYPYIKVTTGEDYPRILIARQMKKDKSKYFGPYVNGGAVKSTIELLRRIYRIRTCNRSLPKEIGNGRACLNYHIKQCDAPCMGCISKEDYQKKIEQTLKFLNGNYEEVTKMLEQKMYEASADMNFEAAAEYRDLIADIKALAQKQKITSGEGLDRDVIAYAADGNDAVVQVFFIREGKLLGREHFFINIALDEGGDILTSFIKQYYSGTPFIPKEILVSQELREADIIAEYLSGRRGSKVSILNPKKGQKEKMIELAQKNAKMVLDIDRDKVKREEARTTGAVRDIFELLNIENHNQYRIEAYDISNTAGFQSVGSMIVYENGKPKRNDYRKFKIQTVEGPNDYGSMYEVLTRRFTHGLSEKKQQQDNFSENTKEGKENLTDRFSRFPDLIMMDGGLGQVNIALQVLDELKIHIPVCGMVKDDRHRTRALVYNNEELPIDTHSESFRLITRIQDEAHRFAIEYHKSLRAKTQVHSILDDIESIGPARRKALMKYFSDIGKIKTASVEELAQVPSMNEASARKVYEFFRKGL
ncbi:MAG: excinuclease ABC subunit UvrC [Lachnospiraceae bacterium]|jgi:excinuclease ABC, C subunit|nr:excinuclease ABC subunit UvrC [Lachnospiraceae bacterium]